MRAATRKSNRPRSKRRRSPRRRDFALKFQGAIDSERRKLQKAIAILKCLEYASMYVHDGDHIDCDDVVSVARALIDDADDKLDSVMWRRAPVRIDRPTLGGRVIQQSGAREGKRLSGNALALSTGMTLEH
jgi:hypothetical protein